MSELNLGEVHPIDLMEEVVGRFALGAQAKGLELVCHPAANMPVSAFSDGARLWQMLSNLVGNAIKFTARGEVVLQAMQVKGENLLRGLIRALGLETQTRGREKAPDPATREATNGQHILLAEDNRENQILGRLFLQKGGYSVDLAENGEVAVQKIEAGAYALVLMDLDMPVLDGFEATDRIRAWEAEEGRDRVPIVALTAHAIKKIRDRCLSCGMDDYLAKPIDRATLLRKVSEALRRAGTEEGIFGGETE